MDKQYPCEWQVARLAPALTHTPGSVDPDVGFCVQCDARTRANCTGVAPIPNAGYWVSHPRSPLVHRCLVDAACLKTAGGLNSAAAGDAMFSWQMRYRDRSVEQLRDLEPATGRPMYENYTALQCSQGYKVRRRREVARCC